jgi:hypothetical protein
MKFFDENLFDVDAMHKLWNHRLNANDKEAGSVVCVISRQV